ncbi:MAG: DUF6443 domain-containing protein, partial [Bacteroidota bacterium]
NNPNNFILSQVMLEEETDINDLSNLSIANGEIIKSYQFSDGLGRSIQDVLLKGSTGLKDVVSFYEYDEFGRMPKYFLPFTADTPVSEADYLRSDPLADQQAFYASLQGKGITGNDVSQQAFSANIDFEDAPLNRVLEQTHTGANWSNKPVTVDYRANTTADAVHDFRQGQRNSHIFAAGALYVTESTDEDLNLSRSFTDKLGRTIMVERELDGDKVRTYVIYDDFHNVTAIVPPQVAEDMRLANDWNIYHIKNFRRIYAYHYDDRQRPVTEYQPGGGTTSFYYNKLDLPVMSEDNNGNKIITKYDILNRPILTGYYKGNRVPADDFAAVVYETPDNSTHNYTLNNSFPTDVAGNLEIHTVLYYDDYDFDEDGTNEVNYLNPPDTDYKSTASTWTRNRVTSSKTGILNAIGGTTTFLSEHIHYDERGRVIQVQSDNHLSGQDLYYNRYNFTGWLLESHALARRNGCVRREK